MKKKLEKKISVNVSEELLKQFTPLVRFKVQLFGSFYYIYDFTKYDLVKNEDGTDMKAPYQDGRFNDAKETLVVHCHKLIKEDFVKQEEAFKKKMLDLDKLKA